ncbi:hypothetical protein [Sphingobacterium suaedae]|uniref:Lipoprotein n=1 Tax=Sphingobacterium suaedae TaxID=1686402 RepID=A0ABW5KID7_9SPHI
MTTILSACHRDVSDHKSFVWDEDVKQLLGAEYLDTWLRKAPFENELKQAEQDQLVFTNAKQVFPFMNRYHDRVQELIQGSDLVADTVVFSAKEILFQDSVWGDVFVGATLLYDHREVFLKDSYLESGSPLFGGYEAATDMYRASLYETHIFAKHPNYKTGLYWVSSNDNVYLLGFYQQGQFVFEAAVPLVGRDTLATLDKMKEVNTKLGLKISEWEHATVHQLQQVAQPQSFWKDPFVGIYPEKSAFNVYLKTKDTPFVPDEKPRKGDYYFAYTSIHGDVSLSTSIQKTEMSQDEFVKANQGAKSYRYFYDDLFYDEQVTDGYVQGTAKAYFQDRNYLEILFSYASRDGEAKKMVHGVLQHVHISTLD